jgi:hypothetical protein
MGPITYDDIYTARKAVKGVAIPKLFRKKAREGWVGGIDQLEATIADESVDAIASNTSTNVITCLEDFRA